MVPVKCHSNLCFYSVNTAYKDKVSTQVNFLERLRQTATASPQTCSRPPAVLCWNPSSTWIKAWPSGSIKIGNQPVFFCLFSLCYCGTLNPQWPHVTFRSRVVFFSFLWMFAETLFDGSRITAEIKYKKNKTFTSFLQCRCYFLVQIYACPT